MMPHHLAKVTFVKQTHSYLHFSLMDFPFLSESRVLCVCEGHVVVLSALSTGSAQNSCKMWMILGIYEFSSWKEETFLSSFRHPLRRKEKSSVYTAIRYLWAHIIRMCYCWQWGAGLRELLAFESGCMAQCSALLSSPCHLDRALNVMVKFAQLGNEHVRWSRLDNEADWFRKGAGDRKSCQSQAGEMAQWVKCLLPKWRDGVWIPSTNTGHLGGRDRDSRNKLAS